MTNLNKEKVPSGKNNGDFKILIATANYSFVVLGNLSYIPDTLKHSSSQIFRDGWFSIAYTQIISLPPRGKIRKSDCIYIVPSQPGVCWRYLDRYRVFALPWSFSFSSFPLREAIWNYVNPFSLLIIPKPSLICARVLSPQNCKQRNSLRKCYTVMSIAYYSIYVHLQHTVIYCI